MAEKRGFTISRHARQRMAQRGIGVKQIAQILAKPDRTEANRDDPEIHHAIRRFGRQFLRVVNNHLAQPPRIVTAFLDRRLRRKR